MSSSVHNIDILPKEHPLHAFLAKLPAEEACDPNPDWVEEGSSKRYVLAFRGENAVARMRRLEELLTKHQPWICKVSQHSGPGSAFIIIFLQSFHPGAEFQSYKEEEATSTMEDWEPPRRRHKPINFTNPRTVEQLALPEAPPAPKDALIPGCKQMETYD